MTNYYNSLCIGRDTAHKKTRFGASGGSPNTTKTSRWWLASLFMIMSLFMGQFVNAQVNAYTFAQSTETYAQIAGTTSTATGDDGEQNAISIGFNFVFGNSTYTTFSISTNGIIKLGGSIVDVTDNHWTNLLTTGAQVNKPLIATFWDDNNLSTGTIRYALTGTPGSQVLTINWHNTKIGGGGGTGGASLSTLLRLYEGTNVIEMVYGSPFTTTNTVSASVGLMHTSTFLSVTPAATSTVSSATANNSISAAVMANLAGKKLTFTPPPPPLCGVPTGLAISDNLTGTTVDLAWTAPTVGTPASYDWEIRTTGAGGSGATGLIANGNVSTASVNDAGTLVQGTAYNLYVRTNCGVDGSSTWAGPTAFTTAKVCPSGLGAGSLVVTLPYNGTGLTNSGAGNNVTATNVACVAGSTSYYDAEDKTYIFTSTLTGPHTIDLTTTTDDDAGIMLYQGCPFTPGSVCVANAQSTTGLTRNITANLTAGLTYYLVVDNFPAPAFITSYTLSIVGPPTTPPNCATALIPADLSSDVVRNPTLSWTAATGSPTGYNVYVGTTSGSLTLVSANQAGLTYTSPILSADTTYYWSVEPVNGNGPAVGCAEQSFTTGVLLNYCTPVYTTGKTSGDLISNIAITGTTLANNSGTTAVNPAYTFFTGQPNYTGDLQAGSTYSVTVTVGTWGTQGIAAWIDYNDDGVFSASEKIGNTAGTIGTGTGGLPIPANHTASFNISLACNPPLGIHRMRVRDVYNTGGALIDPCASYTFGETEDYLVNVTTADPCPIPKDLASSTITPSGATLNWVLGCAETQWDVHIQLASDSAPTASTTPSNPGLTATTLVASTLNQNTAYNVYVRAVCDSGLGVFSAWSTPVTFTTQGVANCATALVPADLATNIARNPTLSWTASASNPAVTGYDVYFGNAPGAPLVSAAQTALTYSPAFLDANTTYYWRVVAKNSIGDAVGCTEQSFTTGTTINYCTPVYTTGKTDGDLISNIAITGTTLSNNSGTDEVNPAYTFFTGQPNYTGDLQAGGTYSVTVTVGTWGTQGIAAWIDYNDDGIFSPSEKIGNTTGTIGTGTGGLPIPANHTASFNISLACNPPLGVHRMRVRDVFSTSGALIDPCASYTFGETEDYEVNITTADPCPVPKNLAASAITNSGASLNWTLGCTETEWDVNVQPAGSGVPTSANNAGLTATTLALSGLTAATAYEYYVRAVCETGVLSSNWAGPFAFTTLPNAPGCVSVVAPLDGATGVDAGDVTISWTAPVVTATEGAATSYDVFFGTTSGALENIGTVTGTSTNIINLLYTTQYFWSVVPSNTGGSAIGCSESSFTTGADPFLPYCSTVSFTSSVEPITSVVFAGINNSSSNVVGGTPGLQNFISTTGNVTATSSYTMTLKGNSDGNFTNNFRVFADWNQDGDFADAGETYNAGSIVNSNGLDAVSAVSTIAVPINALPGTTRMRVKKLFGTTDIGDACLGGSFGQVEDYTLNVTGFTTEVTSPTCGSTLATPSSLVGVRNFSLSKNVTSYRYKAVGPSGELTVVKTTPHFQFSELVGWQYGTTYTVSCELQVDGVWAGYYGPTCTISTPNVVAAGLSQVVSPTCGTIVTPNTTISTTSLGGVTGYRFQVTNTTPGYAGANAVQIIDRTVQWFKLNQLVEYVYGSSYAVEVAVKTSGTYGAFGPACTFSTTSPVIAQCGTTVNAGSLISSTSLGGVTQYAYQVTNLSDSSVQNIDRTSPNFSTNLITGYSSTTSYSISVAVTSTGVQSPYSQPCVINASPAVREINTSYASELKVQGFPNPFTNNFTLDITRASEEKVSVMVYDMIGKLLDRVDVNATDNSLELGANYPAGVYNVVVSQGEKVESVRMVKR